MCEQASASHDAAGECRIVEELDTKVSKASISLFTSLKNSTTTRLTAVIDELRNPEHLLRMTLTMLIQDMTALDLAATKLWKEAADPKAQASARADIKDRTRSSLRILTDEATDDATVRSHLDEDLFDTLKMMTQAMMPLATSSGTTKSLAIPWSPDDVNQALKFADSLHEGEFSTVKNEIVQEIKAYSRARTNATTGPLWLGGLVKLRDESQVDDHAIQGQSSSTDVIQIMPELEEQNAGMAIRARSVHSEDAEGDTDYASSELSDVPDSDIESIIDFQLDDGAAAETESEYGGEEWNNDAADDKDGDYVD